MKMWMVGIMGLFGDGVSKLWTGGVFWLPRPGKECGAIETPAPVARRHGVAVSEADGRPADP